MSDLPIIEGVLKYTNENNISFCMPGHKGGKGFLKKQIGEDFINKILKCDITEVDGVDNLHNSEGIIKEGQELLSQLYGSKKSYFLVNGSTAGNMVMIFSSFCEGDKILVERNCHRSIFNAIIMRKLNPVYIKNSISNQLNAPSSIDMEHFFKVIDENKDAKGMIITYPNYYGICCNLEKIIKVAQKYNMKVLVDSAHGAHFGIHKDLPKSAAKLGADMVVMSAHKTLPSFTQTAYLHVNNGQDIEKADFYVSAFLSTSPSYLFLCSMDYARAYLQEYGEEEYYKLLKLVYKYKNTINTIDGIHILDKKDIEDGLQIDPTRYVLNLNKGYSGHLLLRYLRNHGIQAEMSDASNVVLIFSPFNTEDDFKKLYDILKGCNLKDLKYDNFNILDYDIPELKFMPFQVINMDKEVVKLSESIGRVCAEAIVPYPPGVPILNIGEIISEEYIKSIYYYIDKDVDILGIKEDKIKVVK